MNHYTSIEQSKKLLELGLNPETADMFYDDIQDFYKEKVYSIPENGSSITVRTGHTIPERGIKNNLLLPCWSLGALLELMPRYINSGMVDCPLTIIPFDFENPHIKEHCWIIRYTDYDEELEEYNFRIEQRGNNLIEAAYSMICWLIENNYLKTEFPLTPSVNK